MLYVRLYASRTVSAIAALWALDPIVAAATPAATVVTLITGDRVTIDSAGTAVVRPAADRTAIPFQVVRAQGHTHVIPGDAVAALHAGQLDPRLFDVTELAAAGYDKRATTPVIVTGDGSTAGTAPTYGPAGRSLALVNGLAMAAAQDGSFWRSWSQTRPPATYALAGTSKTKLWLDGRRRLSAEDNLKQIGADVAHERGLLGDGVKVAVIDSGIDAEHPDLAGQVKAQRNFVASEEDDRDHVGHGTQVASVIAGTGAQSDGRYLGVAPRAHLIDAKACSSQGCAESAILESLEWAADQGARIINLSFGAQDRQGEDLVETAVNKLSKDRGVLVVAAAGNEFGYGFPINSPASAESALAVGAITAFGLPSDFSQRGSLDDLAIKPELVAPGENITAARSRTSPGEGDFTSATGTSIAAPHVAGAAALLSQRHPEWKGDRLKAVLLGSAKMLDGRSTLEQGAGLVNIPAALELQLRAEPAAVSFGRPSWPHDDDSVVERKVTLHNDSDQAVSLDLTLEAHAADSGSVDAELFSLSDAKLEIAAHGEASVTLTANTRTGRDGFYSGVLFAKGPSQSASVHVPFVMEREGESYDLNLRFVGRDGEPADPAQVFAMVIDRSNVGLPNDVFLADDSTTTLRLARGTYAIAANEHEGEGLDSTQLIYPALTLERDTEVVLDFRRARRVEIGAPLPDAELAILSYNFDIANFGTGANVSGDGVLRVGRLGPDAELGDTGSSLAVTWLAPGAPEDREYQIHWAKLFPGELLTGYRQSTELADYAVVDTDFARGSSAIESDFLAMASPTDPTASFTSSGMNIPVSVPGSQRIYYGVDSGLAWRLALNQYDFEAGIFDAWEEVVQLEAGESYEQQWNQAVFGPASGLTPFGPNVQTRYGNSLQIAPRLLADNQGRSGAFGPGPGTTVRLLRDGALLLESNEPSLYTEVPAESARYRVEAVLDRPEPSDLSTHVELAWEFVSEATSQDEGAALPVSYIRFLPELNQESAAAKNRSVSLPIRVEPQPDADVSAPESLTAEISYDDGKTWTELDVEGQGQEWSAQVDHPDQSGYVSLRATAIDADDNKVEVTIVRAYRLQ
jgi:subtilisin family serine protease